MDALFLARLQFGLTACFHIIFPTLVIGMMAWLVYLEARWLITGQQQYRQQYAFWLKIFFPTFILAVITGVVLAYQLDWSFAGFYEYAYDVLGGLRLAELTAVLIFEGGFIGMMIFGLNRLNPKLHFFATCMVAVGVTLSVIFILGRNSWMHTPSGFTIVDGKAQLDSIFSALISPSYPYRVFHTVTGALLTVSFMVAGISAIYLIRKQHLEFAKRSFRHGVIAAAIFAPLQIVAGDLQGLNTQEYQPAKVAAMEGLWETDTEVPFLLFAIPDMENRTNHFEIKIPYAASVVLAHSPNGEIQGLESISDEDLPEVPLIFYSFRIMLALGFLMLIAAIWGAIALRKGTLFDSKKLHLFFVLLTPAGVIASITGWIVTEVGRQPWTIYGIQKTSEALHIESAASIWNSLVFFVITSLVMFAIYLYYLWKVIQQGPQADTETTSIQQKPTTAAQASVA